MALYADDNQRPLAHPNGMRPTGGTAGIISVTMSGSTQELALPSSAGTIHGENMFRLVGNGQAVFYALDKASQGGNYTGVTNMIFVPANVVEYFRANVTDSKIYILQGGTAGVVQITLMQ